METGTNIGESTVMVSNLFESVLSVEADPTLAKCARALVGYMGIHNTEIHEGHSVEFVKRLEPRVGSQCVFFLDAHYSRGITTRMYGNCPLQEELNVIVSRFPKAVIVADDVRTMNGRRGFPSLLSLLSSIPPSMNVCIAHDQLIITPRSEYSSNKVE